MTNTTKTTISVNGSKEIDLENEEAVIDAFTPVVERGMGLPPKTHNIAKDQLLSIINRVENLNEQKDGIAADIRDVLAEAKGNGFDVKAIRAIIKLRAKDPQEVEEEENILHAYMASLGMIPDSE